MGILGSWSGHLKYISRQNTIVQEIVQWVPWPGQARRRSRGVSNGGRPPVTCRFHQQDRTPFFRLTPAFGLLHYGRTITFFPAQKEERRSFRCRSPAQPSMAGRQRPFPSSRGTVSARAAWLVSFFVTSLRPLDKTRGSGSHPSSDAWLHLFHDSAYPRPGAAHVPLGRLPAHSGFGASPGLPRWRASFTAAWQPKVQVFRLACHQQSGDSLGSAYLCICCIYFSRLHILHIFAYFVHINAYECTGEILVGSLHIFAYFCIFYAYLCIFKFAYNGIFILCIF